MPLRDESGRAARREHPGLRGVLLRRGRWGLIESALRHCSSVAPGILHRVRSFVTCLIMGLLIALAPFARGAEAPSNSSANTDVRAVVTRSLPFLETRGAAWIEERGCVSCHQTAFLVWTHNDARRRGFPVNEDKLAAWNAWAVLTVITTEQNGPRQGAETLSQILLSRDPGSW